MKRILIAFLFVSSIVFSQQNSNIKKGFIANGYDVVAYFNHKAEKGSEKFMTTINGVKFKFLSVNNLETFKLNPTKYTPQYGGYCAYAIGKTGEKVSINPKTFEIRENKLYLFYNSWGTNTLALWTNEGPIKLKEQADINWQKLTK